MLEKRRRAGGNAPRYGIRLHPDNLRISPQSKRYGRENRMYTIPNPLIWIFAQSNSCVTVIFGITTGVIQRVVMGVPGKGPPKGHK